MPSLALHSYVSFFHPPLDYVFYLHVYSTLREAIRLSPTCVAVKLFPLSRGFISLYPIRQFHAFSVLTTSTTFTFILRLRQTTESVLAAVDEVFRDNTLTRTEAHRS